MIEGLSFFLRRVASDRGDLVYLGAVQSVRYSILFLQPAKKKLRLM